MAVVGNMRGGCSMGTGEGRGRALGALGEV